MKLQASVCAILVASMLTGPTVFAQGDAPYANRIQQEQNPNERDRRDDVTPRWNRHDGRNYGRSHHGERGAGPDRLYYRGGRLPPEYRTRHYVIEDWRSHRLSAPPHGYQWVQNGGDYLLVAIATGVILSVLLNN